ncbi:ribonuclease E inhibitor RraA/Dimethylmenaquinone methyltransferase [Suillus fuscotomentosus]|uniref:Ribonuclease E inhibitor RraA/Dimethylmenaquinone methyltransferase n=1 Tax=Suillus fuscotomentosus TaxID=1912939 RepID=A0AAD4HPQ2_9AGAM|nr:ribonuclease E inhibitor RraA/Dimethylmenaquinone methyltransferase [Suillus fuscotomentosus]KAG1904272.1 ribonuclease E inhibitor RraA/Dimethylmenaquinone methyltransferase [Suillus fuscotomentosus]
MIARTRLLAISRAMSTSTRSSTCPLSQFSACEISDALIKLGSPNGGHIPDIHMLSPTSQVKICAPAYTVQMVLASDNLAPKLSSHFVDTAPPGSVIVVDAPPQTKNAVWGGLMTAGAQARGAVGVIISGRCRDLAEHRAADFPVFARGHSTVGQSPFVRPSGVNVTLTIHPKDAGDSSDAFASVTVTPGDWIIADEDGVICVPVNMVDKVAELAKKGQEIDAKCMADIKAGKGIQASFKEHRGK